MKYQSFTMGKYWFCNHNAFDSTNASNCITRSNFPCHNIMVFDLYWYSWKWNRNVMRITWPLVVQIVTPVHVSRISCPLMRLHRLDFTMANMVPFHQCVSQTRNIASQLPNRYLNQCWLNINWTLKHYLQWSDDQNINLMWRACIWRCHLENVCQVLNIAQGCFTGIGYIIFAEYM